MYRVDRSKRLLVIKKDSVVVRHIRFDGKIIAGMFTNFWGNIEAEEVYLGKGCVVSGDIICKKAIIGAYTRFRSIIADGDVFIQDRCVGDAVMAKNVRIGRGSVICSVDAEGYIIVDGASKLGRLNARKIIATESKI
jgi:predicted acyltransferase (DUF342 family)